MLLTNMIKECRLIVFFFLLLLANLIKPRNSKCIKSNQITPQTQKKTLIYSLSWTVQRYLASGLAWSSSLNDSAKDICHFVLPPWCCLDPEVPVSPLGKAKRPVYVYIFYPSREGGVFLSQKPWQTSPLISLAVPGLFGQFNPLS